MTVLAFKENYRDFDTLLSRPAAKIRMPVDRRDHETVPSELNLAKENERKSGAT